MAAAMSYNFFFSLFPLLFLSLTVIPYLPVTEFDLQEIIIDYLQQILPAATRPLLESIIASLKDIPFQLIILNVFLTLYGATRGIIAMMKAFTKDEESYEIFKRRNIFQLYGIAFLILIVLGTLVAVSIGVLITGESFIQYLRVEGMLGKSFYLILLKALNSLVLLFLIFFSISVIYYLAPATRQRWNFITPGTTIAGILMWLTLIGFQYFFSSFSSLNQIYGSVGAVILLMIWFYYISIILLIGFELNAAIDIASYYRKGKIKLHIKEKKEEEVVL
ncbi:MAG: YihY/virulence factor BrkB family protein, partial [Bacteroidota bacterium]